MVSGLTAAQAGKALAPRAAETDVDTYFHHRPGVWERLETGLAERFTLRGCRIDPTRPQYWAPHPGLDGLVTLEPVEAAPAETLDGGRDVLVGTVRMGYGHHRMARAVCSFAPNVARQAVLLDLLASSRGEALAIRRLDESYSFMSRLTADTGGLLEAWWGRWLMSGGVTGARAAQRLASRFDALLSALPRDVPLVSTYPVVGHLAVHLGFRRVVNLVFDNDPQPFLVVPGALNVTQSPSSLERIRVLGVPRHEAELAGHFVGRDLLDHLEADTRARLARIDRGAPRRLLVAIGGAGAQKRFVLAYLEGLRPLLASGAVKVMVNLGDHARLRAPFARLLKRLELPFAVHHGREALDAFCAATPLGEGGERADAALPALNLFTFDDQLDAIRATDVLLRTTDVLVTKPSELAFVPVPKLHLRRVGDHEAASALRAAALGDGSLECREVGAAVRLTELYARTGELLEPMNERIIENARRGVYDGARRAIELAVEPR